MDEIEREMHAISCPRCGATIEPHIRERDISRGKVLKVTRFYNCKVKNARGVRCDYGTTVISGG